MDPIDKREGNKLATALVNLKKEKVFVIIKNMLEAGEKPMRILEYLKKGLGIISNRYQKREYFLAELVTGGEIFKESFEILKPRFSSRIQTKPLGKFVLGTAQGDIHDLGKNIVAMMLECNGFMVYDLGVDVPPERFVEKVKETGALLVGISLLLTSCIYSVKKTIEKFERSGLRSKVKIIVGGGIVNEAIVKRIGADAYAADAPRAVKTAKEFLSGMKT